MGVGLKKEQQQIRRGVYPARSEWAQDDKLGKLLIKTKPIWINRPAMREFTAVESVDYLPQFFASLRCGSGSRCALR